MIKINKTQPAPRYLIYEGRAREEDKCLSETLKACKCFESEDDDPNQECEYKFKSSVYANKIWKKQLLRDQSNKCCFCESKIKHVDADDVEHFRPKGESKQSISDIENKPGYYWLAYDWDNLLIACPRCNRREKSSLFPLLNPDERAYCSNKNIDAERPVYINPCKEEPQNFITFHEEYLVGIDDEGRGQRTLEELNLNNESLRVIRKRHLDSVSTIIELVNYILTNHINAEYSEMPHTKLDLLDRSIVHLSIYLEDQYAGMVRSNFESEIKQLQEKYSRLTL